MEKKIVLSTGNKLVVHKATHLMAIQRISLQIDAQESWAGKDTGTTELKLLKYDETITFPSLVACTTGKIPTLAEYHALPEEDVELWLSTAIKINPRWFPVEFSSVEEQNENEKKSEIPLTE
jgi:hypothetical protein